MVSWDSWDELREKPKCEISDGSVKINGIEVRGAATLLPS